MPAGLKTEQGPLSEPLRGKPARNMEPEVGQEDRPFCELDEAEPEWLPAPDDFLGRELVAHPSDRMEVPGFPGVRFEILPEPNNEIIHRTGGWEHVIAPHFLEDLLA